MGRGSSGTSKAGGGGGGGGTSAQAVRNQIAQQPPTPQNTPVQPQALTAISQMTDDQLADLMRRSRSADMPNQLNDVSDITQKFVFTAGLNEKPAVLSDSEFQQFMKDNGLGKADVISRSVNGATYKNASGTKVTLSATDVSDMMMYSRLNYIGGKRGGQALGAGTYFDHTYGKSTGYGGHTVTAVLNPKTARAIDYTQLASKARAFDAAHPKFARMTGGYNSAYKGGGNNMAIYALAMGYNVITASNGYTNVIDRSALVYNSGK